MNKEKILEIINDLEHIIMIENNIKFSKIETPEQIELKKKINNMAWEQLLGSVKHLSENNS